MPIAMKHGYVCASTCTRESTRWLGCLVLGAEIPRSFLTVRNVAELLGILDLERKDSSTVRTPRNSLPLAQAKDSNCDYGNLLSTC